ncbi:MAG: Eco57I restriction-modification methylase domain-containing protein [Clostridiales Family XIII bacterium]|jgi:hypothetical protein|nr:Eco57I restriction-modification methylase domain-containing protein [Clostridiales Family XIII bacterium]
MDLGAAYDRQSFLGFVSGFLPDFLPEGGGAALPAGPPLGPVRLLGASRACDLSVLEAGPVAPCAGGRVAVTRGLFRLLRGQGIGNALVAFHDGGDQWRLSLLTSAPGQSGEGGAGLGGNPRRRSYRLGKGAKTGAPCRYLLRDGPVSGLDSLRGRFSAEGTNRRFLESVALLFAELAGGGRGGKARPGLLGAQGGPPGLRPRQEFAAGLIVRIVFCWFLKGKKSGAGLPLMPDGLLSREAVGGEGGYWRGVLAPLLFEALGRRAEDRPKGLRGPAFDAVPCLGGGLFGPFHGGLRGCGASGLPDIPDEWFAELFGLLSRHDFAMDEGTAYDADLSIDPEMLGMIFENLLAEMNSGTGESARRSTGSFYTPREIVDYMAGRSLFHYLAGRTGIAGDRLRALIDYDGGGCGEISLGEAERAAIVDAMGAFRALDPACGSGAFLIGVLQRAAFVLEQADGTAELWMESRLPLIASAGLRRDMERRRARGDYAYVRKLGLILGSVFGADIQSEAAEIAKLRCLLALLAEVEPEDGADNRGVAPLPDLGSHLAAVDSLDRSALEGAFGAGGFDVVISNPPYIGEKGHKKSLFDGLKGSEIGRRFYQGKMDIFYFFFHAGIDLLSDDGVLAFITTNYYLTADGARRLRQDMRARADVLELINFNEYRIFGAATGQHSLITLLRKKTAAGARVMQTFVTRKGGPSGEELGGFLAGTSGDAIYSSRPCGELFEGEECYIRFGAGDSGVEAALRRMAGQGAPLGEICGVDQGIVTGADRFTEAHRRRYPGIEAAKGEGIFVFERGALPPPADGPDLIRPWFKNSDIGRYCTNNENDLELLYAVGEDIGEDALKRLGRFRPILESRRECADGRRPWHSLHWGRRERIFGGEKIVAPQRSYRNTFGYNAVPWYASADVYFITGGPGSGVSLRYILGILNSRLLYAWLYSRGKRKGEMLELYGAPLSRIPIALAGRGAADALEGLVDRIVEAKSEWPGAEVSALEAEADAAVFAIYGLAPDEERAVARFCAEKEAGFPSATAAAPGRPSRARPRR